ncbi:MAG TPA: hypothetical protein VGC67_03840 [Cellulomonas sp.]
MHPDMFLIVYRQQERELEQRREIERSQAARTGGRLRHARRPGPFAGRSAGRAHRAG